MTGRELITAVVTWSQVHTVAAAIIAGLIGGFLLGKLL